MSKFMVNLTAINPSERDRRTAPIEAMVDTGSEVSWLPKKELLDAGITPEGKKRFSAVTKQIIKRDNQLPKSQRLFGLEFAQSANSPH